MALTLGEQLDEVQSAISKLINTNIASYKVGEQEIMRNRLRDLEQRETRLISQIQSLGRDYIVGVSELAGSKIKIGFE